MILYTKIVVSECRDQQPLVLCINLANDNIWWSRHKWGEQWVIQTVWGPYAGVQNRMCCYCTVWIFNSLQIKYPWWLSSVVPVWGAAVMNLQLKHCPHIPISHTSNIPRLLPHPLVIPLRADSSETMRWDERAVHYPLAMLLLALVDQRACSEMEEPTKQNRLRWRGQKAGNDAEMERIG